MQDFSSQAWFEYLTDWQRELVQTSESLLSKEKEPSVSNAQNLDFIDYSYIVFPMAKAYEGFLKKYFFDQGLIDKRTYFGKRFRVGRALNPDVRQQQRDRYWIFDDVVRFCGESMARELWETWLECRNRVFHFFPDEVGKLSLSQVENKLEKMATAMKNAVSCLSNN